MTRKDYRAIARAIGRANLDNDSMASVVSSLSSVFAADNPAYDRDRFSEAVFAEAEDWAEARAVEVGN